LVAGDETEGRVVAVVAAGVVVVATATVVDPAGGSCLPRVVLLWPSLIVVLFVELVVGDVVGVGVVGEIVGEVVVSEFGVVEDDATAGVEVVVGVGGVAEK